jgi:formamidopyrimidine-DNA glycosylase
MIEIPEALTIENQINNTVLGKKIINVVANNTPHKFAWYLGDPQNYYTLLIGKTIDMANSYGGLVEIRAGEAVILFSDGVSLRFHSKLKEYPKKHQLLIEFDDFSAISASVQMYGGLWCFKEGEFDNPYYKIAKKKPSPLTEEFDKVYFYKLVSMPDVEKLSAKAFLATEQRIPGLGNGVLQDILFAAKIHPRKKMSTFSEQDKENLFYSIKSVLEQMALQGGRDTEKDLFGHIGGYKTKLSKNTIDTPCTICGDIIKKENYLGGSIYYCSSCQMK